jgi:hypothetical protein
MRVVCSTSALALMALFELLLTPIYVWSGNILSDLLLFSEELADCATCIVVKEGKNIALSFSRDISVTGRRFC